ncbi:MAG: DUF262 domain-containing protein [Sulfurimonas sp.]|nr:DUF262 domain-containing protein [Sulfurimonas sp.]
MSENLNLKSISEILDKDFFIPSYQRGYRWDSRQVEDLLEDILEFANNNEDKGFYCLQPIVVKKEITNKDDKYIYRVIDGQQRLTTMFIILKYLSKARDIIFSDGGQIYSVLYETRQNSHNDSYEFLKNINEVKEKCKKNIDFYYMSNAFITIKTWFESNKVHKGDFLNVLLKKDIKSVDGIQIDFEKNVKVIWYEIDSNEVEIDVFTRLNIGKIPLTNAELIKALFLLKMKDENEKILLASQWDEIEYKLQNDIFFAFINSSNYKKATRIEFIFDLLANDLDIEIDNLKKDSDKYSFYKFNYFIKDKNSASELWDRVKMYFRVFEELYINNTYYHLVGFITNNGMNIKKIVDSFNNNNKDDFLNDLKKYTKDITKLEKDKTIEKLNYTDKNDSNNIAKILFLFNVISTMNANYHRYPFNLHKKENWSLEHIHAQNSEIIKDDKDRKILLKDEELYVNNDLKIKINEMLNDAKIADEEFDNLQNEIFKKYGDNIGLHTIDNLALLSRDDNSALNNSIFPSKRDKIKALDAKGSFIPIGTKNVFLKYYSDGVKEAMKWNKEDRQAYLEAINKTLKAYIGEEKND